MRRDGRYEMKNIACTDADASTSASILKAVNATADLVY